MAKFQYKAINRIGQEVHGNIEAVTETDAVEVLAKQGRFVNDITVVPLQRTDGQPVVKTNTSRLKISEKERVEFSRQFATALQAQLPILAALKAVGQQNPRQRVKQLTEGLASIIKSGESLSIAFSRYPKIFDRLHVSLVKVGENSGRIDQSMEQLADLTERQWETHNNIITAALYPMFVLFLGLISVAIVVTWILPQILTTLAVEVSNLPLPTRMILQISDFLKGPYGGVSMAIIFVIVLIIMRWRRTVWGRFFWDGMVLRIPIVGPVHRKWAVSRFARTLGILSNAGMGILESLLIVRNCLGNEVLAREIDKVTRQVRMGSSLAEPLQKAGAFPPLLIQIVSVGEKTGKMADMLLGAAKAFDKETQIAIKRFMSIFPAVLITILAMIVGFIVAATLLPIVQIGSVMPRM